MRTLKTGLKLTCCLVLSFSFKITLSLTFDYTLSLTFTVQKKFPLKNDLGKYYLTVDTASDTFHLNLSKKTQIF